MDRFEWLKKKACAITEKKLRAVILYKALHMTLNPRECKQVIAEEVGITEIAASSVMAWCERYGLEYCEKWCRDFLEKEVGEP